MHEAKVFICGIISCFLSMFNVNNHEKNHVLQMLRQFELMRILIPKFTQIFTYNMQHSFNPYFKIYVVLSPSLQVHHSLHINIWAQHVLQMNIFGIWRSHNNFTKFQANGNQFTLCYFITKHIMHKTALAIVNLHDYNIYIYI